MAYCLHIERQDNQISLDEWCEAVSKIPNVRLQQDDNVAINPATGASVTVEKSDGDVEVICPVGFIGRLLGKTPTWMHAITFFEGRGTFRATEEIEKPNNPIRSAAALIAKELNASIVGDEGEDYEW